VNLDILCPKVVAIRLEGHVEIHRLTPITPPLGSVFAASVDKATSDETTSVLESAGVTTVSTIQVDNR